MRTLKKDILFLFNMDLYTKLRDQETATIYNTGKAILLLLRNEEKE